MQRGKSKASSCLFGPHYGRIDTLKPRPCVSKGWEQERLPGVWVSRPELFRTGRNRGFPKRDDDENDQVVSTRMLATCSPDRNKAARMAYKSTRRSKSRDIQERRKQCIGSWCRCAETSRSFKNLLYPMLPCKISPPRMRFSCLCVILLISMSKSTPRSRLFVRPAKRPKQPTCWCRNSGTSCIIEKERSLRAGSKRSVPVRSVNYRALFFWLSVTKLLWWRDSRFPKTTD
jgi:hypothetical protein